MDSDSFGGEAGDRLNRAPDYARMKIKNESFSVLLVLVMLYRVVKKREPGSSEKTPVTPISDLKHEPFIALVTFYENRK